MMKKSKVGLEFIFVHLPLNYKKDVTYRHVLIVCKQLGPSDGGRFGVRYGDSQLLIECSNGS